MLDERKIKALKDHMICEETLKDIKDYDPDTGIVTFNDGSEHQMVECWTRQPYSVSLKRSLNGETPERTIPC